MTDLIPENEDALKTWLVDPAGNIAVSGAGVALLDAQINHGQSPNAKELTSPNATTSSH